MPRFPFVHPRALAAPLAAVVSVSLLPSALAQSITLIPPISGGATSNVMDLSGDGSTVVGSSLVNSHNRTLRWTAASGSMDLGSLTSADARATAVNADGTAVCGFTGDSELDFQAFRWTLAGGMSGLGVLPGGVFSEAFSISADGSVVVGSGDASGTGGLPTAWRQVVGNAMQSIGGVGATGVSADGSVVCGYNGSTLSPVAWQWTAGPGQHPIGTLPGGTTSYPSAISATGTTIVGYAAVSATANHAFRWTSAGGMQDLGVLSGETSSVALGVSADGSTIIGWSGARAWLWTPILGMQDLNTLLPARNIPLNGWTLSVGSAISADGSTIAGNGILNNQSRAWLVHIPCYANCDNSSTAPVLNVLDFTCFLQRFAAADSYANCDNSTTPPVLNVLDFTCFLQKFAAGCP